MTLSSQTEPPVLEMRGVGKHYRGVAALKELQGTWKVVALEADGSE